MTSRNTLVGLQLAINRLRALDSTNVRKTLHIVLKCLSRVRTRTAKELQDAVKAGGAWTKDEQEALLMAVIDANHPFDWDEVNRPRGRSRNECWGMFVQISARAAGAQIRGDQADDDHEGGGEDDMGEKEGLTNTAKRPRKRHTRERQADDSEEAPPQKRPRTARAGRGKGKAKK